VILLLLSHVQGGSHNKATK